MSRYTLWGIYEADERGNFSIYRGDDYTKISCTKEEIENYYNNQPTIGLYSADYERYDELDTKRFRWGRAKDKAWRNREDARFRSGEYTRLPFALDPIADHYAHVSVEADTMIAYTPDEAKGEMDIQVRVKPGRYLTKFYPHLTGDEVRDLVCKLDKANEVRFVSTADDIETVYVNGPRSCMSHDPCDYESSMHPVRVYAAGDLQLAFLSTVDPGEDDFRATARCLVWPEKLTFGRIYGDEQRLGNALRALGYSSGSLKGAKLLKVEDENESGRYILPYVDGCQSVQDHGDHWTIGGDTSAGTTNGLTDPGQWCDYYEEHRDEETVSVRVGRYSYESWCQSAADEYAVYMESGEYWSDSYFADCGFHCPQTGENLPDCEGVYLEDTEETVADWWARENAWQNMDTGDWYSEPQETDEEDEEEDEEQLALELPAPVQTVETVSLDAFKPADAFKPGDRVRFTRDAGTILQGCMATVSPRGMFRLSDVPSYASGPYVDLILDRNGLDGGRGDGGYYPHDLELVSHVALAA